MSAEENTWDLQAAEYVLGTLSDDEQKVYDALYKVDDDWQRRVHKWEARFNPLNDSTRPVEPPRHVLASVLAHINEEPSQVSSLLQAFEGSAKDSNPPSAVSPVNRRPSGVSGRSEESGGSTSRSTTAVVSIAQWKERVRYWQLTTLVAVASLVGVLLVGSTYYARQFPGQNTIRTVAVLQGEAFEPLWTITYFPQPDDAFGSSGQGTVSITVVGQPQLSAQQSHQLWMVLPEGAGVQSVGLVPSSTGETITLQLPLALNEAAEFAVSLEPSGGVPGPEHGPVVARTFIVEAPAQTSL